MPQSLPVVINASVDLPTSRANPIHHDYNNRALYFLAGYRQPIPLENTRKYWYSSNYFVFRYYQLFLDGVAPVPPVTCFPAAAVNKPYLRAEHSAYYAPTLIVMRGGGGSAVVVVFTPEYFTSKQLLWIQLFLHAKHRSWYTCFWPLPP